MFFNPLSLCMHHLDQIITRALTPPLPSPSLFHYWSERYLYLSLHPFTLLFFPFSCVYLSLLLSTNATCIVCVYQQTNTINHKG